MLWLLMTNIAKTNHTPLPNSSNLGDCFIHALEAEVITCSNFSYDLEVTVTYTGQASLEVNLDNGALGSAQLDVNTTSASSTTFTFSSLPSTGETVDVVAALINSKCDPQEPIEFTQYTSPSGCCSLDNISATPTCDGASYDLEVLVAFSKTASVNLELVLRQSNGSVLATRTIAAAQSNSPILFENLDANGDEIEVQATIDGTGCDSPKTEQTTYSAPSGCCEISFGEIYTECSSNSEYSLTTEIGYLGEGPFNLSVELNGGDLGTYSEMVDGGASTVTFNNLPAGGEPVVLSATVSGGSCQSSQNWTSIYTAPECAGPCGIELVTTRAICQNANQYTADFTIYYTGTPDLLQVALSGGATANQGITPTASPATITIPNLNLSNNHVQVTATASGGNCAQPQSHISSYILRESDCTTNSGNCSITSMTATPVCTGSDYETEVQVFFEDLTETSSLFINLNDGQNHSQTIYPTASPATVYFSDLAVETGTVQVTARLEGGHCTSPETDFTTYTAPESCQSLDCTINSVTATPICTGSDYKTEVRVSFTEVTANTSLLINLNDGQNHSQTIYPTASPAIVDFPNLAVGTGTVQVNVQLDGDHCSSPETDMTSYNAPQACQSLDCSLDHISTEVDCQGDSYDLTVYLDYTATGSSHFVVTLNEQSYELSEEVQQWQQLIETDEQPAVVVFENLPVNGQTYFISANLTNEADNCQDRLGSTFTAPNFCPCELDTITYQTLLNGNRYDLNTKVYFAGQGGVKVKVGLSNGQSQERVVSFSPATFLFEGMECTGGPVVIETQLLEGNCGDQVVTQRTVYREPLNCDGEMDDDTYCPENCPIMIGEAYIPMTSDINRCQESGISPIKVCYQWFSGGEVVETEDICSPQLNVCPEKKRVYKRIATDNCGNILEEKEYPVQINFMDLEITPNPVGICPGDSVTLDAGKFFKEYLWSTGETTRTITVGAPKSFSVTVTGESGCVATDEVVVEDYRNPTTIRTLLEEKGFMCIPINIDPNGFTSNPTSNRNFVEDISEDIRFSLVEGEDFISSQDLAAWLGEFLNQSDNHACATSKKGLISSNSNFCSNSPNLYEYHNNIFEDIDLGYWFHIWEGEDNSGCLLVRVNTPAQETHSPDAGQMDFINDLLTAIENDNDSHGFASKQEQMINTLFGLTLNNYADTIPTTLDNAIINTIYPEPGVFLPLSTGCTATNEAIVGIAPSALPVWLPAGTSPAFGVNPAYNQIIDDRALTRFTIYEGENKGLYRAAIKAGCATEEEKIFLGYYNVNKGDYYTFDTDNVSENPIEAQHGVKENLPCPNTYFNIFTEGYTYSGTPNDKAKGELVATFNLQLAPDAEFYTIYTCSANISEYAVNHPIAFNLNPTNHPPTNPPNEVSDGWELHVKNQSGGITRLYVRYEAGEDIPIYYAWNPCSANWELLDASVPTEQMHFLNALVKVVQENIHTALDFVGLVPVFGEIADVANAVIYAAEGNFVEATISAASATAAGWSVFFVNPNVIRIKDAFGRIVPNIIRVINHGNNSYQVIKVSTFLNRLRTRGYTAQQSEI